MPLSPEIQAKLLHYFKPALEIVGKEALAVFGELIKSPDFYENAGIEPRDLLTNNHIEFWAMKLAGIAGHRGGDRFLKTNKRFKELARKLCPCSKCSGKHEEKIDGIMVIPLNSPPDEIHNRIKDFLEN